MDWLGDLYVMQNSYGLIKIGRSAEPENRRRALQSREECRIQIVAIVPGEGLNEEYFHYQLRDYWIEGEWFEGSKEARAAITNLLELKEVTWPFKLDETGSRKWLSSFKVSRVKRKLIRQFEREIRILGEEDGSHRLADVGIWWLIHYGELKRDPADLHALRARKPGEQDYELVENGKRTGRAIPFYTDDIAAAMTLWPDEHRPAVWEGSARDCCIAALKARKAFLPKS